MPADLRQRHIADVVPSPANEKRVCQSLNRLATIEKSQSCQGRASYSGGALAGEKLVREFWFGRGEILGSPRTSAPDATEDCRIADLQIADWRNQTKMELHCWRVVESDGPGQMPSPNSQVRESRRVCEGRSRKSSKQSRPSRTVA